MLTSQQLADREAIASDVLGQRVTEGDCMPCLFADRHSKDSGPRDVRVCLEEKDGKLPTFYCFHNSCREAWAPLNKEMRRRIWFKEHGRDPDRGSVWDTGGVAAAPREKVPGVLEFDLDALKRMQRKDWQIDERWFAERSPVDVRTCTPVQFIEHLYEVGERVMIFTKFKSQGQFMHWVGRGSFRLSGQPGTQAVPTKALPAGGPDGMWYLCQPVSGKWLPNPRAPLVNGEAKLSRRSEESVTAWRYMVLESDNAPPALWMNLIAQLPLPIAAVYTSGGKSIHVLVRIDASSKQEWDRLRRMVLPLFSKLGADDRALTAVRLTRLPGCLRGRSMQKLLYLDPNPNTACIPLGVGGGACA